MKRADHLTGEIAAWLFVDRSSCSRFWWRYSVRVSVPSTSAGTEDYWCGPDASVTVRIQTRNQFQVTESEQTVTCAGNSIPPGLSLASGVTAV